MTPRDSLRLRNIGIAALLFAALAVALYSGDSLRYSDERDYDQLARSLVNARRFSGADGSPTAYRPPGYPAFIAAVYLIIERPLAAKIGNVLLLGLAALLLGFAAERLCTQAGVLTPYLVMAYPLTLYAASLLYPQILGCLLLTLTVLLVSGCSSSARSALVAGACYGVLILAIPFFVLLLPVFALYILFRRGTRPAVRIRAAACWMCAVALLMAPWTVRNYREFHMLIPVSANGGANLFLGNSPSATPTSGVSDIAALCPRVRPGMSMERVDRAMQDCALEWIRQHPRAALKLYAGKVLNFFNFRNELATKSAAMPWADALLLMTYYPLLFIALVRASFFRRYPFGETESLIFILYFLSAFASAIYFTRIRFRIPFDFLLIAVDAAFLVRCFSWRRAAAARRLTELRNTG